jgi:hypothetical protein
LPGIIRGGDLKFTICGYISAKANIRAVRTINRVIPAASKNTIIPAATV